MRVYLYTFGCKANQYETELLRARMESGGGSSVDRAGEADLCLVNSCSVTAKADGECRQLVRKLLRENPQARVVVTGCYATRAPEEIKGISPRVEVYGNKEKDDLPACVGFELTQEVAGLARYPGRARAFVKVQDGCNAPCNYCIVPKVRPQMWNKPAEDVLQEVKALVGEGHGEIVLTGIRLGLYRDPEAENLAGLVRWLADLKGEFRLRLSSLEVTEVTDELIKLTAGSEKVCRHFHVPLQSADDGVLKDMGRWYTFAQFQERAAAVRKAMPDCGLTTDVLVGYPTETDAAFETTFKRVGELGFSGLHVFPFSPRPGTRAAALKPLPPQVLKARAARLIELGDKLKGDFYRRFVGATRMVLAEPEGEGWTDNYLRVSLTGGEPAGRLVAVKIS